MTTAFDPFERPDVAEDMREFISKRVRLAYESTIGRLVENMGILSFKANRTTFNNDKPNNRERFFLKTKSAIRTRHTSG